MGKPDPNLIADGDMEAASTAAWTVQSGATLTKQGDAYQGARCLRVARSTSNNPYASQNCAPTSGTVAVTGRVRSDGNAQPRVYVGGVNRWTGTTSTDWQAVSFEVTDPANSQLALFVITSTGNQYCEFDDFRMVPA